MEYYSYLKRKEILTRHIVHEPLGHYGKWNRASHRRTKTVKKRKTKKTNKQKKKHLALEEGENREMYFNENRISVMHNDKFWTPAVHMSISLTIL